MKIAICLSGETRTWKKCVQSIKTFAEHNTEHEIMYFGHTWTQNSWRIFPKSGWHTYLCDDLNKNTLQTELLAAYNLQDLTIDSPYVYDESDNQEIILAEEHNGHHGACNRKRPVTWNPMSYSAMIANFNKQKYEIENDIKFDIVVKVRWDQYFDMGRHLESYIPNNFKQSVLYGEVGDMPMEYSLQSVNDVVYFGSSRVMDIIDTFYRVYNNGDFFKLVNANFYDGALKTVGYGVMLYKWATIKNIHVHDVGHIHAGVVRKTTKIVDGSIHEWDLLCEEGLKWGLPDAEVSTS